MSGAAGREKARLDSAGAAQAVVEDLAHMREIVEQEEPDAGALRRMSGILRRFFVDGELLKVASPRAGRINILTSDLRAFHRANEERPFSFAAADMFETHGIIFFGFVAEAQPREIKGFQPDQKISLRVEPFANQKVLCSEGVWVTRAQIIKYVANVAHGIHSGKARDPSDFILQRVRSALTVSMAPVGPKGELGASLEFNSKALGGSDEAIEFRPGVVDLVLLYMISTARQLVASPDVIALAEEINRNG